jgi:hypothetical protein
MINRRGLATICFLALFAGAMWLSASAVRMPMYVEVVVER